MNTVDQRNLRRLIERIKSCKKIGSHEEPSLALEGEEEKYGFNMTRMAFLCGSPACIAGHIADMTGHPPTAYGSIEAIQMMSRFLRIDYSDAEYLYHGWFGKVRRSEPWLEDDPSHLGDGRSDMSAITVEETVECLESLGRYGHVMARAEDEIPFD